MEVSQYRKLIKKAALDFPVVAEPRPGLAAADAFLGSEDCVCQQM